jgi:hypothetical protein
MGTCPRYNCVTILGLSLWPLLLPPTNPSPRAARGHTDNPLKRAVQHSSHQCTFCVSGASPPILPCGGVCRLYIPWPLTALLPSSSASQLERPSPPRQPPRQWWCQWECRPRLLPAPLAPATGAPPPSVDALSTAALRSCATRRPGIVHEHVQQCDPLPVRSGCSPAAAASTTRPAGYEPRSQRVSTGLASEACTWPCNTGPAGPVVPPSDG